MILTLSHSLCARENSGNYGDQMQKRKIISRSTLCEIQSAYLWDPCICQSPRTAWRAPVQICSSVHCVQVAMPELPPPPAGWLGMPRHSPHHSSYGYRKSSRLVFALSGCTIPPTIWQGWIGPTINRWARLPISNWHKWLYGRDSYLLGEQSIISGFRPRLCLAQGLTCLWTTAHRIRDKMNLSSSVRKCVKKVEKGKTVGMFGTRLLSLHSWLGLHWEEVWDHGGSVGSRVVGGLWGPGGKRKEENACKERDLFSAALLPENAHPEVLLPPAVPARPGAALDGGDWGGKQNTFPGSSAERLQQLLGLEELGRRRWHAVLQWVPVLLGPGSRQGGPSSPALLYLVKLNGISFLACSKKTACNFPSQIIPSSKTKNSLCVWRVQGRGCAEPALSTRNATEL